jgi:hypothetical protein
MAAWGGNGGAAGGRLRAVAACALLVLTGLAAADSAQAALRAHRLDPARLGREGVTIRDRVVNRRIWNLKSGGAIPNSFDGRYPLGDGRFVRVILSEVYEPDPAVPQSIAAYMSTLLHGGEVDGVTVFLASPETIRLACGFGGEACFNGIENLILMPGVPPASGISLEEILAHEYGHALANGRSNYPFPALLFGTKRWATYEHVCEQVFRRVGSPDEPGIPYRSIPGEAFADAYRILNGGNPALWVFDRVYFPTPASLRLIRADVLDPWAQRLPLLLLGSFPADRPDVRTRRFRVLAPLDGMLRIQLTAPPGSDFDLELRTPGVSFPVARGVTRGRIERIAAIVCGTRSFTLAVKRHNGSGRFALRVSRP